MKAEPDHPFQMKVLPTASRLSKIIGANRLASGRPFPKLPWQSSPSLLARMSSNGPQLGAPILQCSMSTTTLSAEPVTGANIITDKTMRKQDMKQSLMQRLGLSTQSPEAAPQNPNVKSSMSLSMHGKSGRKSPLSLYQRISNAPAPWSRT